MTPLISICIPAYKNPLLLKRLLDSIIEQDFGDYEVICTDDTPNEEVADVVYSYNEKLSIQYLHNSPALGSPANWNKAISLAKGEWIKIMHGDDWFASEGALSAFAEAAKGNSKFIFSAFIKEDTKVKPLDLQQQRILQKYPNTLFANNIIGHPSVTMIHRSISLTYDEHTKWVVDFDYYIRCLATNSFHYISTPLIGIGSSDTQLTIQIKAEKDTIVKEYLYLLSKMGDSILNNWQVYDAYWRTLRNFDIRSKDELPNDETVFPIPVEIHRMIAYQNAVPKKLLRYGVVSKLMMFLAFFGRSTKN